MLNQLVLKPFAAILIAVSLFIFNLSQQADLVDAFLLTIFPGGLVVLFSAQPLATFCTKIFSRPGQAPKDLLAHYGPLHKRTGSNS